MKSLTVAGAVLTGAKAASFVSDSINVSHARRNGIPSTVQLNFAASGAPTGTVTLEGSLVDLDADFLAITSPVALTADPASGSPIVFSDVSGFNFLRLRWTRTGGTMTIVDAFAAVA